MNVLKIASLFSILVISANAQTSFWSNSARPQTATANDTAAVTLGLRFYSTVAGSVTAVRFYKGWGNGGVHTGRIWSSNGTRLAEVTFSNETQSGWQEARFGSPVPIAANTTYVVSYFASRGRYSYSSYYSWSALSNSRLRVAGTAPGVFAYGSSHRFPSQTYNRNNYWVDLVFVPAAAPPPTTYTISGKVTGSSATLTLTGTSSGTTTTDSAGNYQFSGLKNGAYVVAPSRSGYVFSPATASVNVNGASVTGVNFTATPPPSTYTISGRVIGSSATLTLSGTSSGVTTTDSGGNYQFSGLGNGSYVVAPSRTGFVFSPATALVSVNSTSVAGVNFTGSAAPVSRTVTLTWVASTSTGVVGYNVYRAGVSGGPYARINSSLVNTNMLVDANLASGGTYYYVATAVDNNNNESAYSNQAVATVP